MRCPDGARVGFEMTSPLEGTAIWLFRTDQESGTRLVEGGENRIPVWSPDGRFLAYSSQKTDDWVRSAPSLLTPLTPGDIVQGFDLTDDGRRVLTIELARTENSLPSDVLRVVINWIDELRESPT